MNNLTLEREWCHFLYDSGIFQVGEFTLKSGRKSPYYLNFGTADDRVRLSSLGDFFARALQAWDLKPDLLFGPAYKGLPLAISASLASADNVRWGSFRKEAKGHGDAGPTLGRAPWGGCRIALLDDVLTTSQTKVEAMEQIQEYLRASGQQPAEFIGVVVGVDRQECQPAFDVPVYALTTMAALLDNLEDRLPKADMARCREAFAGR